MQEEKSVHIWCIGLADARLVPKLELLLSPEERSRALALKLPHLRRRFSIAHGALRHILSEYLDILPEKIFFEKEARGKPYIDQSQNKKQIHFNLSHSEDLALCGISFSSPIGVDVEKKRQIRHLLELAKRFFPKSDVDTLSKLSGTEQQEAFLRLWTAKEAAVKATGEGISWSTRVPSAKKVTSSEIPLTIYYLNLGEEFVGAVSVEKKLQSAPLIFHWRNSKGQLHWNREAWY